MKISRKDAKDANLVVAKEVVVTLNLFCRNWDLPDFRIFGLLDENFAQRRNGRKFDVESAENRARNDGYDFYYLSALVCRFR